MERHSWPLIKKWWTASRTQTGKMSLMIRKLQNHGLTSSPNLLGFEHLCVFRVLFTYEGNSNDIRLAEKGGKM